MSIQGGRPGDPGSAPGDYRCYHHNCVVPPKEWARHVNNCANLTREDLRRVSWVVGSGPDLLLRPSHCRSTSPEVDADINSWKHIFSRVEVIDGENGTEVVVEVPGPPAHDMEIIVHVVVFYPLTWPDAAVSLGLKYTTRISKDHWNVLVARLCEEEWDISDTGNGVFELEGRLRSVLEDTAKVLEGSRGTAPVSKSPAVSNVESSRDENWRLDSDEVNRFGDILKQNQSSTAVASPSPAAVPPPRVQANTPPPPAEPPSPSPKKKKATPKGKPKWFADYSSDEASSSGSESSETSSTVSSHHSSSQESSSSASSAPSSVSNHEITTRQRQQLAVHHLVQSLVHDDDSLAYIYDVLRNNGIPEVPASDEKFRSDIDALMRGEATGPAKSFIERNFREIKVLGRGGQGVVKMVENLLDGQVYALKQIRLERALTDQVRKEVRALAQLNDPYIVRYYSAWFEENVDVGDEECLSDDDDGSQDEERSRCCVYVQMEYCNEDTLKTVINRGVFNGPEGEKCGFKVLRQLLKCVKYIHEEKVIHRDLKPENIFFVDAPTSTDSLVGDIKVGDFGFATYSLDRHDTMDTLTKPTGTGMYSAGGGTAAYCAPERKTGKYNEKVDEYSVGVIALEIFGGFDPRTNVERLKAIDHLHTTGKVPEEWAKRNKDNCLREVVEGLVALNPDERKTAAEVLDLIPKQSDEEEVEEMAQVFLRDRKLMKLLMERYTSDKTLTNILEWLDFKDVLQHSHQPKRLKGKGHQQSLVDKAHGLSWARETVVRVMRSHAALELDIPNTVPTNGVMAQVESHRIMNQNGHVMTIPALPCVAFARWLAWPHENPITLPLRRYGHTTRDDAELASFDLVTPGSSPLNSIEVVAVLVDLLDKFIPGGWAILLSHTALCAMLDTVRPLQELQQKRELAKALPILRKLGEKDATVAAAVSELDGLLSLLQANQNHIVFNVSRLDAHTTSVYEGVFFQVVAVLDGKVVTHIGSGGRYTKILHSLRRHYVHMMKVEAAHCGHALKIPDKMQIPAHASAVGFTVNLVALLGMMDQKHRVLDMCPQLQICMLKDYDLRILVKLALELAREGISAEYQADPGMTVQMMEDHCQAAGIPWMLLLLPSHSDWRCKLKRLTTKSDHRRRGGEEEEEVEKQYRSLPALAQFVREQLTRKLKGHDISQPTKPKARRGTADTEQDSIKVTCMEGGSNHQRAADVRRLAYRAFGGRVPGDHVVITEMKWEQLEEVATALYEDEKSGNNQAKKFLAKLLREDNQLVVFSKEERFMTFLSSNIKQTSSRPKHARSDKRAKHRSNMASYM